MEINKKELKEILTEQREEYQLDAKKQRKEFQRYLKMEHEEYQRYLKVAVEGLESKIDLITEQYSDIKKTSIKN